MQPLSRRSRRTLLVVLSLVFLVSVPMLILYSQGYRFGEAMSLVKTGGIYVHSELSGTSVFLDDKFVEQNGLFLRNTLVQNLRPNRWYDIVVQKEGHFDWRKTLYVNPNLVTEGRVLMMPEEREWDEVMATTSVPRVIDPSTGRATTTVPNPEYEALVESFVDDRQQFEVDVATTTVVTLPGGATTSSTTQVRILELPDDLAGYEAVDLALKDMVRERNELVTWLEGGNVYVVSIGDESSRPYIFCAQFCKNTIVVDWADDIIRYQFFPGRDDVIIVQVDDGLYVTELDDRSQPNIQPLFVQEEAGESLDFRVIDGTDIVVWDKERERFLELVD